MNLELSASKRQQKTAINGTIIESKFTFILLLLLQINLSRIHTPTRVEVGKVKEEVNRLKMGNRIEMFAKAEFVWSIELVNATSKRLYFLFQTS